VRLQKLTSWSYEHENAYGDIVVGCLVKGVVTISHSAARLGRDRVCETSRGESELTAGRAKSASAEAKTKSGLHFKLKLMCGWILFYEELSVRMK